MYRLLMPQTPIARTQQYDRYHFDEFPNGTNAVVAVLAYTGPCATCHRIACVAHCALRQWLVHVEDVCVHAHHAPGYDMEDGMILNKASVDRGFAHGTLYKSEMIDLRDKGSTSQRFQAEGGEGRPFIKREAGKLVRW